MTAIAVSVTEFKARCLDMIRQVEQAGSMVDLMKHGRIVARLVPTEPVIPTWLRLRGKGRLVGEPAESMLNAADFEALRGGGM